MKVLSSDLIPALNTLVSFSNTKDYLYFLYDLNNPGTLLLEKKDSWEFPGHFCFYIPVEEREGETFSSCKITFENIKPISALKASVLEEHVYLFSQNNSVRVESAVVYNIPSEAATSQQTAPSVTSSPVVSNDKITALSKLLARFKKDNFKGCFTVLPNRIYCPGTYHLSIIEVEGLSSTWDGAYSCNTTQFNKLTKLGFDLSFGSSGCILGVQGETIRYVISLPSVSSSVLNSIDFIDSERKLRVLHEDNTPPLKIQNCKRFTSLLNSASADTKYDLCQVETDPSLSRIAISFYQGKQKTNSFVYDEVEISPKYICCYLQTKQLIAVSQLCEKGDLVLKIVSSFDPVEAQTLYGTTYLMQGLVR
jgi:hypothetical protein